MPHRTPNRVWQLLQLSGFRQLLWVRLVGQFGDGLLQVGLASFVFFSPERAATPERIAAGFAVLLLPFSLVGPFAGVLLDRWSRQRVLVIANLARAGLLIGLAAQALVGNESIGFFVTALLILGINRFILAALSASLPHVVPRPRLVLANAVAPTSGTVAALVGATAGAVSRRWFGGGDAGTALVMLIAAAVCCAAALAAVTFARTALGPEVSATVRVRHALSDVGRGFVSGLQHLRSRRLAARALSMLTAHRVLYGVATVVGILLFRNTLYPDSADDAFYALGLAVAAAGVGVLIGALVTPPVTRILGTITWTGLALFIAAAAMVMFGISMRTWAIIASSLVLGVVAQSIKIGVDATVQRHIDDEYRGRVFTIYDLLYNVGFVVAAALAAVVLPTSGQAKWALFALALGYLALGAWYLKGRRGS